MVTDQQVRNLFMHVTKELTKDVAAAKAGMSPNTSLRYRKTGQLPSQMKKPHLWRTRTDPIVNEWPSLWRWTEFPVASTEEAST